MTPTCLRKEKPAKRRLVLRIEPQLEAICRRAIKKHVDRAMEKSFVECLVGKRGMKMREPLKPELAARGLLGCMRRILDRADEEGRDLSPREYVLFAAVMRNIDRLIAEMKVRARG